MEEKKRSNAFRTVLLVFGIIFSVVLVPGLILGIPVGGAVVTPDYARHMGATYYAKDARESVEIARKVLGA